MAGLAALLQKDFDRAASEVERALFLNPNYAFAYNCLGSIHTYSGRPLEAIAVSSAPCVSTPLGANNISTSSARHIYLPASMRRRQLC